MRYNLIYQTEELQKQGIVKRTPCFGSVNLMSNYLGSLKNKPTRAWIEDSKTLTKIKDLI